MLKRKEKTKFSLLAAFFLLVFNKFVLNYLKELLHIKKFWDFIVSLFKNKIQ